MDKISFDDFAKLDIRIAEIKKVEEVAGADKLLKLTLDVGELGERTVVAGIKEWYKEADLEGRLVCYLANLVPRELKGVVSEGMLLAADDSRAVLLEPEAEVAPGAKVR